MVTNLLLLFFLASCSSLTKRTQDAIKTDYQSHNYKSALAILNTSKIHGEKKNEILYELEKGKLLYSQQKYFDSSLSFEKSLALVENSFTKSISKEVFVAISSDKNSDYTGTLFERSFIYLYQAMNFILIAQRQSIDEFDEETKKYKIKQLTPAQSENYRRRSRSMLLAWDSFNQDVKRSLKKEFPLLSEIPMNIFAAKIHQTFNEKNEDLIALQLLKDAYRKLSQAMNQKMLAEFSYVDSLKDIGINIALLTRKYQSWRIKDVMKLYSLKITDLPLKSNVSFFIESSAKASLESIPFSYTLNSAIENIENKETKAVLKTVGIPLLTYFATGTLGLGYTRRYGDTYVRLGSTPLDNLAGEVGLEFYLPGYKNIEYDSKLIMLVKKGKHILVEKEIYPFAPVERISVKMNQEILEENYKKMGARVGIKYVLAILAAYSTYNALDSSDNPFASTIALGQYVLASKAIKESEQADTRYWVTLPRDIYYLDLNLPQGDYHIEIYTLEKLTRVVVFNGQINVNELDKQIIPLHI